MEILKKIFLRIGNSRKNPQKIKRQIAKIIFYSFAKKVRKLEKSREIEVAYWRIEIFVVMSPGKPFYPKNTCIFCKSV